MPRVPASKCGCGCGQAPAETTRSRKVSCDVCGFGFRTTRQWLALMGELPACPICQDPMSIECLYDLEVMGAAVLEASPQYAKACERADRSQQRREGKGKGKRVPYRPQCRACCRPMRRANATCSCGFHNDPRGGGYYATGSRDGMPF